jgi:putative MATE family efflux protein
MGVTELIVDESNIRSSVLKLALPSVAEQVLFMVVGVVSTIFVGQIGKEAMSAVALINPLVGFIIALFVAISTGSTVLVARLIGEGDIHNAREAVRQSVVLAILASCVISVICYVFAIPIIGLFFGNAEPEVIRLADTYFRVTLFTFPLLLVNTIVSGNLRGAGDTKTPMFIGYAVNIVNVLFSWLLIFGLHLPFLEMKGYGITGAAAAVAIARGVGGLLSMAALFRPSSIIKVNFLEKFRIHTVIVKRVLRVGLPATFEQIIMQGGFLVLQIVISSMGTTAIAVYSVGMSINSICFIPVWGFGIAATTLIGQCLGAKKPELAEKSGWETQKIALAVTVVLTVIVFIFAEKLVGIYSRDAEVIRIGTIAIRIFSISQPFLSIVVVISGALRGAGDIMYVMVTSFVGIWAFRILITVLLNRFFGLGIMGVWLALCLDFMIRSIMYLFRYRRGRWKAIVI